MSTEPTSEEADRDVLADVREAVAAVPGESSTRSCGCEWKRVAPRTFCYHGAWVSGDVLTKFCAYHEWYNQQPAGACGAGRLSRPRSVEGDLENPTRVLERMVQREASRQERARWRGTENRA